MMKFKVFTIAALFVQGSPVFGQSDECLVEADRLAQLNPNMVAAIGSNIGISTGFDLLAFEKRLFFTLGIYGIATCKLSDQADCMETPDLPREFWLSNLLFSGVLIQCLQGDVAGFNDKDRQAWDGFQKQLPDDLRLRQMVDAAGELGIDLKPVVTQ